MKFSFLDALGTTFVAMTIVFALLIILQYIISLQSFIIKFSAKRSLYHKVDIVDKKQEEEILESEPEDDLEVVAAIAAVLAAYLDISQSSLKIKSIKRISNNSGWGI